MSGTQDPGDVEAARQLLEHHGKPAFVPRLTIDDSPRGSRLGGTPWLSTPWPTCPTCTNPLRFLLQLDVEDVPQTARWAFEADLIQLFLCQAQGKEGHPQWLCQSDGAGWEPFAPSTLVRHVEVTGLPMDLRFAVGRDVRERAARFEHAAANAYRELVHDPPLPPPSPAELTRRADQMFEVPASDAAFYQSRGFLHPLRRVEAWEEQLDVPAYGDLDLDEVDLLREALDHSCSRRTKLGGWPAWIQDPHPPSCRECGTTMRHLFQLATSGTLSVGGDGTGWLFVCASCNAATFTWQR